MRVNVLRERLNAGEGSLGCRLATSWPSMIELMGYSGQYECVPLAASLGSTPHTPASNLR